MRKPAPPPTKDGSNGERLDTNTFVSQVVICRHRLLHEIIKIKTFFSAIFSYCKSCRFVKLIFSTRKFSGLGKKN
jgi:hypothetical protein